MLTIFEKMLNGEIKSFKILEDDNYCAMLDNSPLVRGHVIVIPKIKSDHIFDLSDEHISGIFIFAKRISNAMKKSIMCKRIGLAVIGLEVQHAHIHLVPMNNVSDMIFLNNRLKLDDSDMTKIADKIKSNL